MNLLTLISFCIAAGYGACSSRNYVKPTRKGLDEFELDQLIKMNLDRARNGYQKVEYSLPLMDAANYAAYQLALRRTLITPYFRTCSRLVGYAYKIQGYLKSAKKYFGSKICFNNFPPYTNPFAYDILYDCTPKGVRIYDFYEYGYGTWFDNEGNGYMVRLFSLRGSNMDSGIGSSAPGNTGLGSANPMERSLNATEKKSTNGTQSFDISKTLVKNVGQLKTSHDLFDLNAHKLCLSLKCKGFYKNFLDDQDFEINNYFNQNLIELFDSKEKKSREKFFDSQLKNLKADQDESNIQANAKEEIALKSIEIKEQNIEDWLDELID